MPQNEADQVLNHHLKKKKKIPDRVQMRFEALFLKSLKNLQNYTLKYKNKGLVSEKKMKFERKSLSSNEWKPTSRL